jgi:hypothetical protein
MYSAEHPFGEGGSRYWEVTFMLERPEEDLSFEIKFRWPDEVDDGEVVRISRSALERLASRLQLQTRAWHMSDEEMEHILHAKPGQYSSPRPSS